MKKSQNDIRRSPLQLSNCKSNGKFETRNKIETVVASRVLMNMELVEGKMLTVFGFLYWVTRPQVHLHRPSTKVSKRRLLVCLKQQASTKSTSEQRFSERKAHTLKQREKTKKTPRPIIKPYHTGALPPPSPICKTPMQDGC